MLTTSPSLDAATQRAASRFVGDAGQVTGGSSPRATCCSSHTGPYPRSAWPSSHGEYA